MKALHRLFPVALMILFEVSASAQGIKSESNILSLERRVASHPGVENVLTASTERKADGQQGSGTVHGWVRDSKTGNALPGATVLLKGTSIGAATDLHGRYSITDIPPGSYTMRTSYVGYDTREEAVIVRSGSDITLDVKLKAVGLRGKKVVVTAQASGQNTAINEQLTSHNIVNIVSAARIQELPDANAAESVGRLPGVYVLRSGGEGYEVQR